MGDFQPSAKARCEWDSLHFDPTEQKLHEFLDALQKTAKESFGPGAQKFIDRAINAKIPGRVKKIPNRTYFENKPYNDIVLHLERKMHLKCLDAPDGTTLVTLNSVNVAPLETKKKPNQRGNFFHFDKNGHYKAQCRKLRKNRYYEFKTQNGASNTVDNLETKMRHMRKNS